jgi:hypothetical protein
MIIPASKSQPCTASEDENDYEQTNKFEEYFGHRHVSYSGLLVIGRDRST